MTDFIVLYVIYIYTIISVALLTIWSTETLTVMNGIIIIQCCTPDNLEYRDTHYQIESLWCSCCTPDTYSPKLNLLLLDGAVMATGGLLSRMALR